MSLLFIIMIVLIIILLNENSDLKKENNNLKCVNFGRINFCPNCGHNFVPIPSSNIVQNNVNNKNKVKDKYVEKEIKNSLILTVGSVLIVLSAIAFLASTWNTTGNFIKTLILFFMLIVFLLVSYIANKYLNLKQTSKTFYYIALAYIPIVLLSVAMFSLFGNYLSLNGEGRYIYLTVSSMLVSSIYYFNSDKRNSKTLFIFNIIFQLLSVVFFVLIFTNKISNILFGVLIYSTIISICYLINKIYFNEKVHLTLSTVLCFSISMILVFVNFINVLFNNIFVVDVISFVLMLINLYLVLVKILNKDSIYKFVYPLTIVLTFNNLSYLFNENTMFMQSLILVSFIVTYLYNLVKEQQINIITYVEMLVSFFVFYIIWMITGFFADNLIPSYILFSVVTILSLIHYVFDNKYKLFSSVMIAIGIIVTSISTVSYFEFNSIILEVISFTLILISMSKNINISLRNGFKWVGIISLFVITLFFKDGLIIYNLVLYFLYLLIPLVYGIVNKDDVYKISSYVYINIVLLNIFDYAQINYSIFIIPLTTVILSLFERLLPTIRSKASDIYLILSYIISTLMLFNVSGNYNHIGMLILSLSFLYYIIYYNKNKTYLCVPFIGMIPHIYFSSSLVINEFNMMYIVSILSIIGICSLIYYKKSNLYITMFYFYSFFHLICLENIKYISILILIGGSFICYLIKNNKIKDIYRAFLYILCLVLYNTILVDLGVGNLASLSAIAYILVLIFMTRTILKKYGEGYKIWEYIFCIIINLIVLGSYTNEYDIIIYIVLLTIVVIISYILKYGPIFLICLISIVINSLILTRTIWGAIPWWLYILIIGGILIGFAVYNEVKDKKDKDNSIKKYLDL